MFPKESDVNTTTEPSLTRAGTECDPPASMVATRSRTLRRKHAQRSAVFERFTVCEERTNSSKCEIKQADTLNSHIRQSINVDYNVG